MCAATGLLAAVVFLLGSTVASAGAPGSRWRLVARTSVPLLYFQGMTQDNQGRFYFDGIDNGLFVTNGRFHQLGGSTPYIPASVARRDKYNHIGAIAFDAHVGVLLPMECYDDSTDVNCARTGAIGVAAPSTLRWRYEVKLNPRSIAKAMWCAVSPDGKLLWTSSGSSLLAYRMSDLTRAHAWPEHRAISPVRTLRHAVPPSGITGATFYQDRLFVAGSVGDDQQVWSINPTDGRRRLEISRHIVGESEGLDAFAQDRGRVHSVALCRAATCLSAVHSQVNRFGGVLHWMIMPIADGTTPATFSFPVILSFSPISP